jgi:hypothetical protein
MQGELSCTTCGAEETHPRETGKVLIRAYKVCDERGRWWSQCLICSGHYRAVSLDENPANHNPKAGWFVDPEITHRVP